VIDDGDGVLFWDDHIILGVDEECGNLALPYYIIESNFKRIEGMRLKIFFEDI
jgi:hypothetical protein